MANKPAPEKDAVTETSVEPSQSHVSVIERHVDAERQSVQRAVTRDFTRRQDPGAWTTLPNGELVRKTGNVGFRYPHQKAGQMLGEPSRMLLNPKPDFNNGYTPEGKVRSSPRYQWRVRTSADPHDIRPNETAALHRAGRIEYVETKDINPNCTFAVYTPFGTPNNEYVTYGSQILCEIKDPELAYAAYTMYEDMAIDRVSNINDTVRGMPQTRIDGRTDVEVKGPFDQRTGG